MKVTIKDVAREANVATSTVSRVLSNSHKISDKTKEKVNEAIKKLNYTPNIIARGLANNRTRILAVILPKEAEDIFSNPFFVQAMKGISIYAQKENYYIMYAFKQEGKDDKEWFKKFIDSNLVDGICLLNSKENDDTINYLNDIEFPFVVIGRPDEVNNVLWVDNNNVKAMYDLVQMLIEYGHKEIAFIGAKANLNVSRDRLKGYKQALIDNGIEIKNSLIYEAEEFTQINGSYAINEILDSNRPTAVVATDDLLAFGAQETLNELGVKNMSIAGFNNIPMSEYQNPPLSSVDINAEELGFYATKLIIDKLEEKSSNRNSYIIDTKLIERESIKKI
ncbi:MAG: LacI family DNA-binding transcriptional regulator [Clostridium sp.]|uniref:LacI family DNA-binding transcriptional regulator n=1 Tax=Clostridium sp. TaxID=1506 RepID=UPI001EB8FB9B|nr:LacI family DNA-binding transcriptional regulator [Clostridium sp.]MBS5884232.1 LacI family DNA-binding transcriptional regulator [Clostridium sp.]MDU7148869.1 LacI family DNA-binding transcriptional regulator [Clostridium sp.]